MIVECLKAIVGATDDFPRIERELFPEMAHLDMYLLSVSWEENHVQSLVSQVTQIFDANTVGPRDYIRIYDQYTGKIHNHHKLHMYVLYIHNTTYALSRIRIIF